MAKKDIIQGMIYQLGQSQNERLCEALGIHFADIDERSSEDLALFSKKFASFVQYYQGTIDLPSGNWSGFFPYDAANVQELLQHKNGEITPHLALFFSFLELYKKPQNIINRLTGRHLDFYYQDVLRLKKKSAVADKVHLLIKLKKKAEAISISSEDVFSAGFDETKVELLYAPTSKTIINLSKVDSLRSIFVDSSGKGRVHSAPIANSSDGLGGKLEGDENKWSAFGHSGLPDSEMGFALASPLLKMKEGLRKIVVTLTLSHIDSALNDTVLEGSFEAFVTGEKTWLGPHRLSPKLEANQTFTFELIVPEEDEAVVNYDAKIHGYTYNTTLPVLQIFFKPSDKIGTQDFLNVRIEKAQISVGVSNISSLTLENDTGSLDAKKAFLPFGPKPTKGSRFKVGYAEALSKKLSELKLMVEWKDAPVKNFATHYSHYGVSGINNSYFTTGVIFKDGGTWNKVADGLKLFESGNASLPHTFSFSPGTGSVSPAPSATQIVYALNTTASPWAMFVMNKVLLQKTVFIPSKNIPPEQEEGFITFSLEKGFLHSDYRTAYVKEVMEFSKNGGTLNLPSEAYTPMIQSISLSYKAHSDEVAIGSNDLNDFSNSDLQFFHIAYFGQMREHRYQREHFESVSDKSVRLLPSFDNEGELLIGLKDLNAGDSLSLLFQVAEGSADPDLSQEKITWSVLCDNYWLKLLPNEVFLDSSNQLLVSGIIQFVIPLEATTSNTILPSELIWIKAAVGQNVGAVSQMISIDANAVEAEFVDQNNDVNHLLISMAAGKISMLKKANAAIKGVTQPYASFGGAPLESEQHFNTRISERLRHKDRAISSSDFERIVLRDFPSIHRVRCIPHAKEGKAGKGHWLAAGNVMIVVIPAMRNKNANNILQPKVDANTLSQINQVLKKRMGMQLVLHVKNPHYQIVQVDFKVKFHSGFEFNYYSESLKQALREFLSPWAYEQGRTLSFGGIVYKSVLLDFVEELNYVDYLTDFKMYSYASEGGNTLDLNEAKPERPDAILVSAAEHLIGPV